MSYRNPDEDDSTEIAAVYRELEDLFNAGSNGANVFLPYRTVNAFGVPDCERTQAFPDALDDALECPDVIRALRAVLQHSNCEYVVKLRKIAAKTYAGLYAEGVAEIRSFHY